MIGSIVLRIFQPTQNGGDSHFTTEGCPSGGIFNCDSDMDEFLLTADLNKTGIRTLATGMTY